MSDEELTHVMRGRLSKKERERAEVEGVKAVHHQLSEVPATKLDVSEVRADLERLDRHVGRYGFNDGSLTSMVREMSGKVDYFARESMDRLDSQANRQVGLLILIAVLFALTGINFFWG